MGNFRKIKYFVRCKMYKNDRKRFFDKFTQINTKNKAELVLSNGANKILY